MKLGIKEINVQLESLENLSNEFYLKFQREIAREVRNDILFEEVTSLHNRLRTALGEPTSNLSQATIYEFYPSDHPFIRYAAQIGVAYRPSACLSERPKFRSANDHHPKYEEAVDLLNASEISFSGVHRITQQIAQDGRYDSILKLMDQVRTKFPYRILTLSEEKTRETVETE